MRTTSDKRGQIADAQLLRRVRIELRCDARLFRARTLDLEVHAGVVTLRGSVATESVRLAAEEAVRRADGVHAVVNDIGVSPPIVAGT